MTFQDNSPPLGSSLPISLLEPNTPITCESLDAVIKGAEQFRRTLKLVSRDLEILRSGRRVVYAVDFSELHTYLWPDNQHSSLCRIVTELLESSRLGFTLLPGTIIELIRHLRHLSRLSETSRRSIDSYTSRPMVVAFLRGLESTPGGISSLFDAAAIPSVDEVIRKLGDVESLVEKIQHLNGMDNLLSLGELLDSDELPFGPHEEVFRHCRSSLELRRRGERLNNLIDAHNYALVYALSDAHFDRKNTIYCLVTSSPHPTQVFRRIRWDPEIMPEMSLVRHPIQVLYLAHLQTESAPAMHELNQMMEELEYLVRSWDKPVLRRYRRGQEPAWTEISLPNDRTYTETFLRYMKRYNMLFAPVRDAIETDLIATENRRRMRAVSAFGTESRVMGISEGEDKISTRSTFLLFDKLTQLALVTCSRLKASVKGIEDLARDVDVEGIIVEADRLEVVLQDMPSPQRQDVLVCDKRVGEVLISGSIFDDFYTLVWPSGANFTEFLWRVQSLLSEAQPQQPLSRVGDKAFDGVLVYTESADQPIIEVPMSVPLDLNADDLFAVSRGMPVHMVRIATPLGDFFYDFTTAGKQGQRVGFMSHLPLRDLVAWAVYRTSRRRLGLTEVERVVDTILLAFSRRLNRQ